MVQVQTLQFRLLYYGLSLRLYKLCQPLYHILMKLLVAAENTTIHYSSSVRNCLCLCRNMAVYFKMIHMKRFENVVPTEKECIALTRPAKDLSIICIRSTEQECANSG